MITTCFASPRTGCCRGPGHPGRKTGRRARQVKRASRYASSSTCTSPRPRRNYDCQTYVPRFHSVRPRTDQRAELEAATRLRRAAAETLHRLIRDLSKLPNMGMLQLFPSSPPRSAGRCFPLLPLVIDIFCRLCGVLLPPACAKTSQNPHRKILAETRKPALHLAQAPLPEDDGCFALAGSSISQKKRRRSCNLCALASRMADELF